MKTITEHKPSVLITSNSMNFVNPKNLKRGFTLEELYAHLDCTMVEVVYPPNPVKGFNNPILICDEEALFNTNNTVNLFASAIAGQKIVGNAILTESKNLK